MSSPRVQKILEGLAEQLHRQGYSSATTKTNLKASIRAQGRDSAGRDCALIDLDSATWASGNRRAIVAANPASDSNSTAGMFTQSHSSGQRIDGSVSFVLYVEIQATQTGAHAQFVRDMLHILRGQLGAPVNLLMTANGTEPTLNGLNGAVATASTTDAGTYLPYGMTAPGGV